MNSKDKDGQSKVKSKSFEAIGEGKVQGIDCDFRNRKSQSNPEVVPVVEEQPGWLEKLDTALFIFLAFIFLVQIIELFA